MGLEEFGIFCIFIISIILFMCIMHMVCTVYQNKSDIKHNRRSIGNGFSDLRDKISELEQNNFSDNIILTQDGTEQVTNSDLIHNIRTNRGIINESWVDITEGIESLHDRITELEKKKGKKKKNG